MFIRQCCFAIVRVLLQKVTTTTTCVQTVFRKIFLIKFYDVTSECITFSDCSVSDAIYKRKLKFLTKLQHSENTICKLFEKYIIDELDIV